MYIERVSRTQKSVLKAGETRHEVLYPGEFLAGYKTSNEGYQCIKITEMVDDKNTNTIEIINQDTEWARTIILFIRRERRMWGHGNRV